jgi:hypothetical protein
MAMLLANERKEPKTLTSNQFFKCCSLVDYL